MFLKLFLINDMGKNIKKMKIRENNKWLRVLQEKKIINGASIL